MCPFCRGECSRHRSFAIASVLFDPPPAVMRRCQDAKNPIKFAATGRWRTAVTTGTSTSGRDVQRAAQAFSDAAERIRAQAGQVDACQADPEKAGRKFAREGSAYQEVIRRLGANVRSFAEHGDAFAAAFRAVARGYSASDQAGADELGKVR